MWSENVDDEIAGDVADATDVDWWTKMGRLRALRADAARAELKPEEEFVDNNEGTEDDDWCGGRAAGPRMTELGVGQDSHSILSWAKRFDGIISLFQDNVGVDSTSFW